MRLSPRRLNRTLLLRQHLLERVPGDTVSMAGSLVGLHAQEPLPPYLSLAARLQDFDPYDVTRALEEARLVRLVTLRGTLHLLRPEDAVTQRVWTRPVQERERKVSQVIRPALGLDPAEFVRVLERALDEGPLPQRELSTRLVAAFPGLPPAALGQLARVSLPLVQLPPRGCWKQSGGVVYERLERWVGLPMTEPDVPETVRRYLQVYGPASTADVTAWSGITRLGPVLAAMADLVRHEDQDGRVLYDLPGAPIADEDTPAPVRLLGTYDNLWLSHAGRDRVTEPDKRRRWMGRNGGSGMVLLVDGWLEGLWRPVDGRVEVTTLFRELDATERSSLAEETDRVEALLAR